VPPSGFDKYTLDKQQVPLTHVEPIVLEVADTARGAGATFRHQLRYLRARHDLDPEAYSAAVTRP